MYLIASFILQSRSSVNSSATLYTVSGTLTARDTKLLHTPFYLTVTLRYCE